MLALRDSTAQDDALVPLKVILILSGLYIWEFVTSLHYEWGVFRGHRTYRWTIWIYLVSRWTTLVIIILALVRDSMKSPISCQAWVQLSWGLSFLGQSPTSLLIILRILAIWNKNRVVSVIAAIVWLANASLQFQGVILIRAAWEPVSMNCVIMNIVTFKISVVSWLVTDIILLLIMLAGLLRISRRNTGTFELWRFLWKQGVLWLAIATVAELPQTILTILDINCSLLFLSRRSHTDQTWLGSKISAFLNALFLFPSLIMMVIAGTRIHRSLQHFTQPTDIVSDPDDLQKTRSSRLVSKTKDYPVIHIPSNRLEVSVHTETAYEEYPMSQMNHCGTYPNEPHKVGIDDNEDGRGGKTGVPMIA